MPGLDPAAAALWRNAEAAFRADPARAQALCEQLLARAPAFWGAHWMLSRLLQAQHRFRAAVAHARASARGLGADATPHEILLVSSGLISTGEYEICARLLNALAPVMPLTPQQLAGVVEQRMMLDDPAAALPWLGVARDAGVESAMLSLLRGNALTFLGRLDESAAAYEDAIRRDPRNPHAYYALASLDVDVDRAARIARLEKAVADVSMDNASRATLSYALFKELDRADAVERAWPHLERAMAIRKATSSYDAGQENAIFDRIIDAYPSSSQPGVPAQSDGRVPLFIIGEPRSGTTLIERVLGNHPDVVNCGELSDLRMAYKWASDYYCEGFLDLPAAERFAQVDPRVVGERYLASTGWRIGAHRFHTDKHPGNLVFAGLALAALPQAKIIHVRKQPMDACFGCLRESFAAGYYDYSYSFDDVASHHGNYSRFMHHLRHLAPERILDVRYEDLVADPASGAQALLSFSGLSSHAGVQDITANLQPVTTASSVQVRSPIHAGRVGYWKRYERQLRPLREALERAQKAAPFHEC